MVREPSIYYLVKFTTGFSEIVLHISFLPPPNWYLQQIELLISQSRKLIHFLFYFWLHILFLQGRPGLLQLHSSFNFLFEFGTVSFINLNYLLFFHLYTKSKVCRYRFMVRQGPIPLTNIFSINHSFRHHIREHVVYR